MADAPPPGPPPPKVPEGWKAVWNDQYNEWFYVNTHTKESTWEKPTAPAPNPRASSETPGGPPPGYGGDSHQYGDEKKNPNNPYNQDLDADARYAAKLQAEENARAGKDGKDRGLNEGYYGASGSSGGYGGNNNPQGPPPAYGQQPPEDQGSSGGQRGLLGKILGGGRPKPPQGQYGGGYGGPPQQQGYGGGYGPPQGGYGGYPPQGGYGGPPPQGGYGGYPPPGGYGGYPPPGGYGGYGPPPQQPMYQQQPAPQKQSHGIGAGGAAALGLGGGLLGGMLLEHELDESQQQSFDQGYMDGQDNNDGGDMGGDGGDFGGDGGDMGGDF